jgi:hypothetical protein
MAPLPAASACAFFRYNATHTCFGVKQHASWGFRRCLFFVLGLLVGLRLPAVGPMFPFLLPTPPQSPHSVPLCPTLPCAPFSWARPICNQDTFSLCRTGVGDGWVQWVTGGGVCVGGKWLDQMVQVVAVVLATFRFGLLTLAWALSQQRVPMRPSPPARRRACGWLARDSIGCGPFARGLCTRL